MRVLLVEDERSLSAAVVKMLRRAQFEADAVYTGLDGLDSALSGGYDAIILDVMLPGLDGLAILEEIRRQGVHTPVLMLTARGELDDRVRGLTAGADYYLPKPFEQEELIACLRAITRRRGTTTQMCLAFGDIKLNPADLHLGCAKAGNAVKLGAKEYQMMELFLRNPGRVLPKELILDRVWGLESESDYNALEVYVSFLRKKLAFIGSDVKIRATRGVGYALEET